MSFTPTKIVHTCFGCERPFIVCEEAIAKNREEAIPWVEWCQECTTGKPHPEEQPAR